MKINEVRRTVPSFKLLKYSKVYDILIRKSSTIHLFCDCYKLQSLQMSTVFSSQKGVYTQCTCLCGLFVYKKRKSLNRIDWKFTEGRKRAEIGLLVLQIPNEKFLKHSSYLRKSTVTV